MHIKMSAVFRGVAAAFLSLSVVSAAAAAPVYSVSDDGGITWTGVSTIATAQSASDFYGYDYGSWDANPPFAPTPNAIDLFLHEDTGASGAARISLGMIISGPGGDFGFLSFDLIGAPASATPGVEDDWLENSPMAYPWKDGSGAVNGSYEFGWGPGQTDGFTIGGLGDALWTVLFSNVQGRVIYDDGQTPRASSSPLPVFFLGGDPASPTRLALGGLNGLMISSLPGLPPPQISAVPLPAAAPLLAGALLGLFGLARRGRRSA